VVTTLDTSQTLPPVSADLRPNWQEATSVRGFVRHAGALAVAAVIGVALTVTVVNLAIAARLQGERLIQWGATTALVVEVTILAALLLMFGRRILAQTAALVAQRDALQVHAMKVEDQAAELSARALELERQTREAKALARRLAAANEELEGAVVAADDAWDALAAEQRFLRQIIDVNPNFVFAKDRAGRFTLVNRAVADAYGTTVHALIGKTDADFNPRSEEVDAIRRTDLDVLQSLATRYIAEERLTDATGAVRWLQTVKRPIIGDDGQADQVLGVSTDITERKRLETQLLQAQKMEAIGRLAGGVAHDFNNLLTVITSYTGMIIDDIDPDDRHRADLEEIKRAADRAARLTRQLLAFSRKQVSQPRTLDLEIVLRELETMLRRLIGEDIELEIRYSPDPLFVKVDPGHIEQVIVNLAVNARDAMPDGGRLVIETAPVTITAAPSDPLSPLPAGEYVGLTVSDTGTGMDRETMSHLFEPFFTTKPAHLGTSLGLSTVYGIAQQAGGDVRVESVVGTGTRMQVVLPRLHAVESTPREAPPSGGSPRRTSGTILLVEDDPALCVLSRRVLASRGYTVLAARDGNEALAISDSHADPIDLLATDVVMPGMNGGALVQRVTALRPDIKVLYMSGYTEDDVVRRGIAAFSAGFLQKPFTPDVLCERVAEVLGG
jgi:two-component system, cell cycle sensor histidine kinase and response regulator CckA